MPSGWKCDHCGQFYIDEAVVPVKLTVDTRWRRYAASEKGQAARDRFEASHITIPLYDGKVRVPRTPENEARVAALLEKQHAFLMG